MSRDPARIRPFLNMLATAWECFPDERFGQFVANLTRDADGAFQDAWEWENSRWREAVEARLAALREENE